MGRKVSFETHVRPSNAVRATASHLGDCQSSGDKRELVATRYILGRECRFFSNGEHEVVDVSLGEEESYSSHMLRLAHASILSGKGEGDKSILYVDASNPSCEVWMFNQRAELVLANAKKAVDLGLLTTELVVDGNPMKQIRSL